MAWANFPLPETAGHSRIVAAYQELIDAARERKFPADSAPYVAGRKCQLDGLRSTIIGHIAEYGIMYSVDDNTYDVRRFSSTAATAPATPPALGTVNIFKHVFGESYTTWPESAARGYKCTVAAMNHTYEVLNALRTRIYPMGSIQPLTAIMESKETSWLTKTWPEMVTTWEAMSWGTPSVYGLGGNAYLSLQDNSYGQRKISGQRWCDYAYCMTSNTDVTPSLMLPDIESACYMGYSTYCAGVSYGVDFRIAGGSSMPPLVTSVPEARAFGSPLLEWRGGGTGEYVISFDSSGLLTSNYYHMVVGSSPVDWDSVDAWGLAFPEDASSFGAMAGWPRWLAVNGVFDKQS